MSGVHGSCAYDETQRYVSTDALCCRLINVASLHGVKLTSCSEVQYFNVSDARFTRHYIMRVFLILYSCGSVR